MDVGIAHYYLKQYDEAVKYYMMELQDHDIDLEIQSDVEYNVCEALHQKYITLSSEVEKQECIRYYKELFPESSYHVDDWREKIPDPVKMKQFFEDRLATLHNLCNEIKKRT